MKPIHVIIGGARGEPALKHWYNLSPEQAVLHKFDAWDGVALGKFNATRNLLITAYEGGSSLLAPDEKAIATWRHPDGSAFADALKIKASRVVTTVRLEDWCRAASVYPDFVSLNIQGSELDVLEGLGPYLQHVVGLQLEAAFVPYYLAQPSFWVIARYCEINGFEFFSILAPNNIGRMSAPGVHQLFEAHCLWLRKDEGLHPDQREKLAFIADLYGQPGYAAQLRASNLR